MRLLPPGQYAAAARYAAVAVIDASEAYCRTMLDAGHAVNREEVADDMRRAIIADVLRRYE